MGIFNLFEKHVDTNKQQATESLNQLISSLRLAIQCSNVVNVLSSIQAIQELTDARLYGQKHHIIGNQWLVVGHNSIALCKGDIV